VRPDDEGGVYRKIVRGVVHRLQVVLIGENGITGCVDHRQAEAERIHLVDLADVGVREPDARLKPHIHRDVEA
jgi:hypothetical protein